MTMHDAMEAARKLAGEKRMGCYVVRVGEGFAARLWCDDCVSAVVLMVSACGGVVGV